ncbi:M24 family metallopeptidase [Nonlabens xiamenensis]|uniref:M24 family metallopeptidase n=1 Tax=Nonlabens xiamenensis TaxID=2341043 RepID=UPI000F6069B7|nr:M24 family metallopeptidase [Nonlabens xiamenensis]
MQDQLKALLSAEEKAAELFRVIQSRGLIRPGLTEKEINTSVFDLAKELFGIEKYWHKRIVRAGSNTLHPYDVNPPNLTLKQDDIVFLDFGPIFDHWEADFGRTYVLGDDPIKIKLAHDSERLWHEANQYFLKNPTITGAQLYAFCTELAQNNGWEFGGPIAGHLIGSFPHEKLDKEDKTNYIHPENHISMNQLDTSGNQRFWIIEIHLVDRELKVGSFFEQLAVKH